MIRRIETEMDTYRDDPIEPVCKFGPGGDFVTTWPPQPTPQPNSLIKLLGSLNQRITGLLGSELDLAAKRAGPLARHEGKLEYAIETDEQPPPHTPPVAIAESDRGLSGQTLLFPDDCRISSRTEHKQKHRIRTHHRTAKKRPLVGTTGQGSLFEADLQSAKTA